MSIDIVAIRKDFPILKTTLGCNRLVYLDNAATTHKPKAVVEAISQYYYKFNSNVFRSGHYLARKSTEVYKEAKEAVLSFFGASSKNYSVVFVRNATEALNLSAWIVGRLHNVAFNNRDTIVLSHSEHNSNFLPWKAMEARGIHMRLIGIDKESYAININEFKELMKGIGTRVLAVSIPWVSNVLGVVNDIHSISEVMSDYGGLLIVDAAQSAAHIKVDLDEIGVDMLAFSGHKMYGPMGIGGLILKNEILEKIQEPFITGGGVVDYVSPNKVRYITDVDVFIAGTPNVAGAVGLKMAIGYMSDIGFRSIVEHESELVDYTIEQIIKLSEKHGDKFQYIGSIDAKILDEYTKTGVFAFHIKGGDINEAIRFLDEEGVAVRGGKHCAHILHRYLGIGNTLRISFGLYNNFEDIDIFFDVFEAYLSSL